MTDKNWNDDLRKRMSEYTENPPEGLWEALEAAGAVGSGAAEAAGAGLAEGPAAGASGAAGSGAVAGGGLLGWLFGRRSAPVWMSLAGVAAAVAAVFVLRGPAEKASVNPAESIIVDNSGIVAQADGIDSDDAGISVASDSSASSARKQNDLVSFTNPADLASPETNQAGFVHDTADNLPEEAVVPAEQGGKEASQVQNAIVLPPSGGESADSGAKTASFAPGSVNSAEPSSDEATDSSSFINSVKPSSSDDSTEPSSSVISTGAERSGEIPQSPDKFSPHTAPDPAVVPLNRSINRSRPLIAATLVGSGMPGSSTATNSLNYGLKAGNLRMSSSPREATMLSRNRITETSITRRMDFQLGLMVSFDITRHWGLETGLMYTRLASTATSISGKITSTAEDKLNYLGIPLHVVYTPLQLRFLSAYLSAGPELEYGLARNWNVYDMIDSGITASDRGIDFMGDFVLSGSLNAGLQIHPTRHGAFFVQPGVVFRHVWDTTLESYYTDHPVSFRLSAGYRITF